MEQSGLCDDDMRVMLFQGRQMGVAYNLPGEDPMAEIGELLGGEPDEKMVRLDGRLALVVRVDRENLPVQYVVVRGPKGAPQKRASAFVGRGDARERAELSPQAETEYSGLCGDEVFGDCVVVRLGQGQRIGDINAKDAMAAQGYVFPLGAPESREAGFGGEEEQGSGADVRRSRTEQSGLCDDEEVRL